MTPTLVRLVVVAIAALLPTVGVVAAANAHAELAGSNPRNGQRMQTLPKTVSLRLSEEIQPPAYITVTAPDGHQVNDTKVTVQGSTVRTRTTASIAAGTYTVAYRIISKDGHPVTGKLRFSVAQGEASTPQKTSTPPAQLASPDAGAETTSTDQQQGASSTPSSVLVIVAFAGFAVITIIGFKAMGRMHRRQMEGQSEHH